MLKTVAVAVAIVVCAGCAVEQVAPIGSLDRNVLGNEVPGGCEPEDETCAPPVELPPACDPDSVVVCGEGTVLVDGECIADESITCGPGTEEPPPSEGIVTGPGIVIPDCDNGTTPDVAGECIPDCTIICGGGTTYDPSAKKCFPDVVCWPGEN